MQLLCLNCLWGRITCCKQKTRASNGKVDVHYGMHSIATQRKMFWFTKQIFFLIFIKFNINILHVFWDSSLEALDWMAVEASPLPSLEFSCFLMNSVIPTYLLGLTYNIHIHCNMFTQISFWSLTLLKHVQTASKV